LSTDDIVFEDVKYREPKKARRPDRDRRWACLAYEIPRPEDLPIFLDRATADAIERHALRDTSVELGGIMLGLECVDDQTGEPFVWVTESLEAKHYENTQASFTYTHDSWEEITRERDKLYPDLDIVGWYHTHPDFGIFLSSHDLFIHRNFFNQPLQLAYPIRQTRGFFRWRDGGLDQVGGYYISSDRGERIALARLVNDLESIPNADPGGGGGGGLSPRLEAELIAMLSRPYQAQTSSVDRTQLAAFYGLLGLFAGVVIVAVLACLYTLTQQMHDQTEAISKLEKSVEQTDQTQATALAVLLEKNDDVSSPKKFVESYNKAKRDLEAAKVAVKDKEISTTLALADNKRLAALIEELKEEKAKIAEKAKKEVQEYEEDHLKVRELRSELKSIYETPPGQMSLKYSTALYAAITGWIVAILAGLGLLALWISKMPLDDDLTTRPGTITVPIPGVSPNAGRPEEPPHQIV
jgi:proteasome lid subunit RPN8/RPN11